MVNIKSICELTEQEMNKSIDNIYMIMGIGVPIILFSFILYTGADAGIAIISLFPGYVWGLMLSVIPGQTLHTIWNNHQKQQAELVRILSK